MKLIIDIDEDVRVAITRMGLLRIPDDMQKKVDRAIQGGTPLPKGHGRLIDADEFINDFACFGYIEAMNVDYFRAVVPTIIEADKE